MRWARRGSAPCRKARPGVLFMELKGWWGRCRKAQKFTNWKHSSLMGDLVRLFKKKPTSFHNEAGIINKPKKLHYKSM